LLFVNNSSSLYRSIAFFNLVINYRRQKREIPFIVTACVREAERRGMAEVGIYRVSGSASDLGRLKKSFETSECSVMAVTGFS